MPGARQPTRQRRSNRFRPLRCLGTHRVCHGLVIPRSRRHKRDSYPTLTKYFRYEVTRVRFRFRRHGSSAWVRVRCTRPRSCAARMVAESMRALPRLPHQCCSSSAAEIGKPAVNLDQLQIRGLDGLKPLTRFRGGRCHPVLGVHRSGGIHCQCFLGKSANQIAAADPVHARCPGHPQPCGPVPCQN